MRSSSEDTIRTRSKLPWRKKKIHWLAISTRSTRPMRKEIRRLRRRMRRSTSLKKISWISGRQRTMTTMIAISDPGGLRCWGVLTTQAISTEIYTSRPLLRTRMRVTQASRRGMWATQRTSWNARRRRKDRGWRWKNWVMSSILLELRRKISSVTSTRSVWVRKDSALTSSVISRRAKNSSTRWGLKRLKRWERMRTRSTTTTTTGRWTSGTTTWTS